MTNTDLSRLGYFTSTRFCGFVTMHGELIYMTDFDVAVNQFYEEYSKYASNLNHVTPLSHDDFKLIMSGTASSETMECFEKELHHLSTLHDVNFTHPNNLSFVLPRPGRGFGRMSSRTGITTGIEPVSDLLDVIKTAAIKQGSKMATDMAQDVISKVTDKIENLAESLGTQNEVSNNGSSVKSKGFGSNGGRSVGDILNKPLNIKYSSGVVATVYPPRQNLPTRNYTSTDNSDGRLRSADLACIVQRVPPGNAFSEAYWNYTLIPNLQLKAQASVGFNISARFNFSYTKIVTYFNLVMDALAKYFFMVNTYSVVQGPGADDVSRSVLREMFQTSDLQYLALLRERLDALPIPPKMIERSAFLYSSYKSNPDSDVSNNIGFVPVPLISSGNNFVFDAINMDLEQTVAGLGELLEHPNVELYNTVDMLARVFPNWVNTTVGATQAVPEYSGEFTNIFINSPGWQSSYLATAPQDFKFPQVSGETETVQFCVCNEYRADMIGDQQAACSIYNSSTASWSGTLEPQISSFQETGNTLVTNRYTYAFDSNSAAMQQAPAWVPSNRASNTVSGLGVLALSQPYANFVCGSDSYNVPPFSTYSLIGNSVSNMSQPTIDWMKEMFDLGTLTQRDNSSRRPRQPRRDNGRSRSNDAETSSS
uniref:Uncharacterized protein n=1 Tax=viral metagenome TaxID=1070528 RepID=A0A2V0RLB1_9ZZZZ